MFLRFQFCTHQRVCILYFLKKVKFVVPYCTDANSYKFYCPWEFVDISLTASRVYLIEIFQTFSLLWYSLTRYYVYKFVLYYLGFNSTWNEWLPKNTSLHTVQKYFVDKVQLLAGYLLPVLRIHQILAVLLIRILIHMFLRLPDPDPALSSCKNSKNNLDS